MGAMTPMPRATALLIVLLVAACEPAAVRPPTAIPVQAAAPFRVKSTAESRVLPTGLRLVLDRDPTSRLAASSPPPSTRGASRDPKGKGGLVDGSGIRGLRRLGVADEPRTP